MRAAFALFDTDRSGALSRRELRAALSKLGLEVDRAESAEVLKKYDTNGDGTLDIREFNALVEQLVALQRAASSSAAAAPPSPAPRPV